MNNNRKSYEELANQKVQLLKTFISKGGNIYYPGIYEPFSLPEKAYLDQDCYRTISRDDVVTITEIKAEEVQTFTSKEVLKKEAEEAMSMRKVKTEVVYAEDVKKESTKDEAPQGDKVFVNTATKKELVAIKGIGNNTANKIIEAREASPFINLTDLEERVSLPFSNEWGTYNLDFHGQMAAEETDNS